MYFYELELTVTPKKIQEFYSQKQGNVYKFNLGGMFLLDLLNILDQGKNPKLWISSYFHSSFSCIVSPCEGL